MEDHPFGWICHLSGWKRVLETSFPHMRGYYFALLDKSAERIEAGLPVFHVKSRLLGDRLVSIPFATLCDPLVSSKTEFHTLLSAVQGLSVKLRCKRIEIRASNAQPFLAGADVFPSHVFKHHFLKLNEPLERIWGRFNQNVRRCCRRAQTLQVRLREKGSRIADRSLGTFFYLHRRTRRRLGLPLHPYRFFETLWHEFAASDRLEIMVAEHNEKAVGAIFALKFKDRFLVEYIADELDAREVMPGHFLYWNAIQAAFHGGFKVFDFGRTDSRNEGLMRFKNSWGTEVTELPHYFWPKAPKAISGSDEAVSVRLIKAACRHAPDFLQKIIGGVCYRHMG